MSSLFDETLLRGILVKSIIESATVWFCQKESILRYMDYNGGTLSYAGLEALRLADTKGAKRVRSTVLPGASEIKRAARIVERYTNMVVPYEIKTLPEEGLGECLKFDKEAVVRLAIKPSGLEDAAPTRSIRMSQSFDGSNLSKNNCHVRAGISPNDF